MTEGLQISSRVSGQKQDPDRYQGTIFREPRPDFFETEPKTPNGKWVRIRHFHVTQPHVSIDIEMAMFWRMLFGVLCHDAILDTMGQLEFWRLVSQKRKQRWIPLSD